MTRNEINKGNALIAEFMNLESDPDLIPGYKYNDWYYSIDDLRYHSNWNWLIPVVEKCFMTDNENDLHMKLNDALLTLNITEVWNTVIEFINWYDE